MTVTILHMYIYYTHTHIFRISCYWQSHGNPIVLVLQYQLLHGLQELIDWVNVQVDQLKVLDLSTGPG